MYVCIYVCFLLRVLFLCKSRRSESSVCRPWIFLRSKSRLVLISTLNVSVCVTCRWVDGERSPRLLLLLLLRIMDPPSDPPSVSEARSISVFSLVHDAIGAAEAALLGPSIHDRELAFYNFFVKVPSMLTVIVFIACLLAHG